MADRDSHTRLTAAPSPTAERRRAGRVPVRFPATLTTESLEMEVELAVENVSRGGLFVRSDFLEPKGTSVALSVAMPNRTLEVRGKVAWVAESEPRGPGMGIEIDDASRERFEAAGIPKIA